ncbi:MAG: MotA/TolQ/ExbB proton channel family protein [Phycisphaerales bacterium]
MTTTLMPVLCMIASAAQEGGGGGGGGTEAAAGGLVSGQGLSIFDYVRLGGSVTWVLLLLSVVAVGLIIANAIMMRVSYMAPAPIQKDLETLLSEGRADDAIAYAKQPGNDRFLSAVVARALLKLKRSRFGVLELRSAMEQAGQAEAEKADRLTAAIGICAAVGPMLGLFGTVLGLIGAFRSISALEGAARSQELAKFMSHALIATAAGLVVGIPCTIAYSMFRKRFERVLTDVGEIAERLVSVAEQAISARSSAGAARPTAVPPIAPAVRPASGAGVATSAVGAPRGSVA